ncbi:hypothetical protein Q7P37_006007 [Cladosporium fusiforme]
MMAPHHKRSLRERFDIPVSESLYNALIAVFAEFIGTTFFLFFALAGCQIANTSFSASSAPARTSVQAPTSSSSTSLLYQGLSVSFSLAINAWVFFRITSALFNPAITLGMCLIGSLNWRRGLGVAISQILGGMTAAGLVSGLLPGELRAETVLVNGTSVVRGFFIEVLLTAAFVFSVFMLAADKSKGTFIAPIGIGLALFIAQLVGGPFTGASLNPARSFGPAVAAHHFPGSHWIYWIGPMLGSVLAAGFYKLTRVLENETALAVRGENVLGHRRGISNSSTVHAGAQTLPPKEAHMLAPVPEHDLEKGLKESAVGSGAPESDEHAQPHYLSGVTAVHEPGKNHTDTGTAHDHQSTQPNK